MGEMLGDLWLRQRRGLACSLSDAATSLDAPLRAKNDMSVM